MSDKYKKVIACVLLALEVIGIFLANFLYVRYFLEKYLILYLLPVGVALFLFLEAFAGKLGGY